LLITNLTPCVKWTARSFVPSDTSASVSNTVLRLQRTYHRSSRSSCLRMFLLPFQHPPLIRLLCFLAAALFAARPLFQVIDPSTIRTSYVWRTRRLHRMPNPKPRLAPKPELHSLSRCHVCMLFDALSVFYPSVRTSKHIPAVLPFSAPDPLSPCGCGGGLGLFNCWSH